MTPVERVANYRRQLVTAMAELHRLGMTMADARQIDQAAREFRYGSRRKCADSPRCRAAYVAVAVLEEWTATAKAYAAGTLRTLVDDGSPF